MIGMLYNLIAMGWDFYGATQLTVQAWAGVYAVQVGATNPLE